MKNLVSKFVFVVLMTMAVVGLMVVPTPTAAKPRMRVTASGVVNGTFDATGCPAVGDYFNHPQEDIYCNQTWDSGWWQTSGAYEQQFAIQWDENGSFPHDGWGFNRASLNWGCDVGWLLIVGGSGGQWGSPGATIQVFWNPSGPGYDGSYLVGSALMVTNLGGGVVDSHELDDSETGSCTTYTAVAEHSDS